VALNRPLHLVLFNERNPTGNPDNIKKDVGCDRDGWEVKSIQREDTLLAPIMHTSLINQSTNQPITFMNKDFTVALLFIDLRG
jgi:hypothetical protein